MKIAINYELLDKAREAKTGFSLRRYVKNVGMCSIFASPLFIADNISKNSTLIETLENGIILFLYYCMFFRVSARSRTETTKGLAEEELKALSHKLKDIFVDTDPELLKDVFSYKTEYSFNFEDSILPKLEQKKYITVPVHSEWDNNTRSLVQEHVVGTREYALSHGEPEQKKAYSPGIKQMVKK